MRRVFLKIGVRLVILVLCAAHISRVSPTLSCEDEFGQSLLVATLNTGGRQAGRQTPLVPSVFRLSLPLLRTCVTTFFFKQNTPQHHISRQRTLVPFSTSFLFSRLSSSVAVRLLLHFSFRSYCSHLSLFVSVLK